MSYLESYYQRLVQPPIISKIVGYEGPLLLFKEYIRRLRFWYFKSGAELFNWRGNIALDFDNSLVVPEEMCKKVTARRYWPDSTYVALHALYWGMLLDKYPNTYDEMNPFEAVILLFELGEEFKKDQGFVEIVGGGGSVTMHTMHTMNNLTTPFIEVSLEAVRAASM